MNDHNELDELERELGESLRLGLRRAAALIMEEHRPHAPAPTADGTVTPGTRLDDTDLEALEPLEPLGIEATVVSLESTPRARPGRRRWLAAAAAAVVLIIGAGIAVSIDDRSRVASTALTPTTTPPDTAPPRVIPLPPSGATPSAPVKGEILLSLQACEGPSSLPWSGILALYADGRLLWHTYDDPFEGDPSGGNDPRPKTAWLEQRLTSEGTELLRSEFVSSGLLGPGQQPPNYSCPPGSYRADARIGDHYEYYVGKLPRDLVERIAEPASWLPARAWEDRAVRPFVPASYSVCITGLEPRISVAEIATALPARLGDLVRARDWGENHWGPAHWLWCTEVATQDARAFAEALDAAAIERSEHPGVAGPEYLFEYQHASRSALLHISFWPELPAHSPSGMILR